MKLRTKRRAHYAQMKAEREFELHCMGIVAKAYRRAVREFVRQFVERHADVFAALAKHYAALTAEQDRVQGPVRGGYAHGGFLGQTESFQATLVDGRAAAISAWQKGAAT